MSDLMFCAVGFTVWCFALVIGTATEPLWNRGADEKEEQPWNS